VIIIIIIIIIISTTELSDGVFLQHVH